MAEYYEYIVIGCGGIGSGAMYWLSRRAGKSVLGLEQFKLAHEHGGSQDHSRIIRLMYHDESYTRLTPATYETWGEVEEESGLQLVHKTGSLELATKRTQGENVLDQYAVAMTKQNIPYTRLTNAQLRSRYPTIVAEDLVGVLQPDGGLVDAALGNSTHIQLARSRGARVIDECPVTRIDTEADGTATVFTTKGTFRCRRVIVTAGSWTNHVLGSVGVHIPLCVTQEQVTYFATPHVKKFTKKNFPIFIYHGDLDIYGLPMHVNSGSKIGVDAGGPEVTPETRTYIPDADREAKVIKWLSKHIPEYLGPIMYTKTCLYAMTYDRNFVIDTLARRDKPQVVVCQGAGHAYKFASLLGKILSELAVDGKTTYPISPFTLDRPAITDPTFPKACMQGIMGQLEATKSQL